MNTRTHLLMIAFLAAMPFVAAAQSPATAPTTAPAPAASIPAELRQRLLGRWLRPDGGYILTVKEVTAAGAVTALYNNPNPIKVSRAEAVFRNDQALMAVELRDTGYPGNFYTLRYDPTTDQFLGIYHHLGIGEEFEVNFTRLPAKDAQP